MMPHVIQHELFIRAATEGRRDHIYQACMSDPLTAATMPLDRIVAMCDELIAAHGDRSPRTGRQAQPRPLQRPDFAQSIPSRFAPQWDAAQIKCAEDYISRLAPDRPVPRRAQRPQRPKPANARSNPLSPPMARSTQPPIQLGADLKWQPIRATRRGYVDLGKLLGKIEWSVAYAYAEIDSAHPRDAILRCGSDDGIQIRLNGAIIHHHEIGRAYRPRLRPPAPIHLPPAATACWSKSITTMAHGDSPWPSPSRSSKSAIPAPLGEMPTHGLLHGQPVWSVGRSVSPHLPDSPRPAARHTQ